MSSVSCLLEINDPLVLDASVVVNLNATGFADRILSAIPERIYIPEPVVRELKRGALKGHSDATDLDELLSRGIVDVLKIPVSAQSEYILLVSGAAAGSLGDGEAATIASAFATNAWAAIDERKARRICSERYQEVKVASTVDLLAHPDVMNSMTHEEHSAGILAALEVANMQVQNEHMEWVVSRIDPARIERCLSLPRHIREGHNFGTTRTG